jgi:hypothetical protein
VVIAVSVAIALAIAVPDRSTESSSCHQCWRRLMRDGVGGGCGGAVVVPARSTVSSSAWAIRKRESRKKEGER